MHLYAVFSGQASNQHFASSPKMSVSEPAADADQAAVEAALWDRQDAASERPSEAAFQAALIPSVDDTQFETTKASVLEKLAALQSKHGTLSAYLQKRYADPVDLQAFLVVLVDMAQAEKPLWTVQAKLRASSSLDDCTESPILLPLAAFSFAKTCSVKPDADHQLVLDLAERFMLEGFLSSTEPVIVTQTAELIQVSDQLALKSPWADDGALQPFSLGFLKGKARVHTLMGLMSIFVDNNIDPKQVSWQISFFCESRNAWVQKKTRMPVLGSPDTFSIDVEHYLPCSDCALQTGGTPCQLSGEHPRQFEESTECHAVGAKLDGPQVVWRSRFCRGDPQVQPGKS